MRFRVQFEYHTLFLEKVAADINFMYFQTNTLNLILNLIHLLLMLPTIRDTFLVQTTTFATEITKAGLK